MINRLQINGLFGRFDYDLDFDRPVTILTGPNGFGKSTVLRMIEGLGNGDINLFFNLDYSSVNVWFDNEQIVKIIKQNEYVEFTNKFSAYVEYDEWKSFKSNDSVESYLGCSESALMQLSVSWGEHFSVLLSLFNNIKKWSGKMKRITEQRMYVAKFDAYEDEKTPLLFETILDLPFKMRFLIERATKRFSEKSSEIDASYLNRLFNSDEITEEQYHVFLKRVNEIFDQLEGYNLMTDRQEPPPFQPKHAAPLKVYFDTFFEKYAVYDTFLEKLDLFVGIVNNRLMFKKLEISREKGFKIIDEKTKEHLSLKQLSSGEKQVILMYFDLIFNDKKDLLLLIDEPEISMHIAWQKRFVDDLIRIAEHGNFRAIVATHSPQLIGKHRDLQIDLGEQYGS